MDGASQIDLTSPPSMRSVEPVIQRAPGDTRNAAPLQRVPDMTEQSNKPSSINAQPTANGDAAAAHDAKSTQRPPESGPVPQEARKATRT